jgi:hypothetical protein
MQKDATQDAKAKKRLATERTLTIIMMLLIGKKFLTLLILINIVGNRLSIIKTKSINLKSNFYSIK